MREADSLLGAGRVSDGGGTMTWRMRSSSLAAEAAVVPGASPGGAQVRLVGYRCAYLLGIGGVGMSAGAELLLARGVGVCGSDLCPGARTRRLERLGVAVDIEDRGEAAAMTLSPDVDLVVASAAIPPSHPRLVEARRRGIAVWKYADLLGALMSEHLAVCIAGCHGKTTTTALVAAGLVHAGRDPSFVVGGDFEDFGTGARCGHGAHFVAEACEFDRTFHHFRPRVAVITNIDEDHLDYYRDLAEIQEAFRLFAALVPEDGRLIVCEPFAPLFVGDERIRARIETYGFGAGADWRVGEPEAVGQGHRSRFSLAHHGRDLGPCEVGLLGRHNVLNAAAAMVTLVACGVSIREAAEGLGAFRGVGRRLELVADRGGVLVFDDYGHHPVEVGATLETLQHRYEGRRIVLVFQPHQASRTRRMLHEFAAVLSKADEVLLPPIFFARDSEEERRRVTSENLAACVRGEGGAAIAFPDLDAVVEYTARRVRPGDVVVTMGAGNVDEVARGLAARLR